MASTSVTPQVTPMTLITLKVSYEGSTRRFKLPLKDLGINVLETKVSYLPTSIGTICCIDRTI